MPTELLNNIGVVLQVVVALSGAFILAFWLSMVIWTFRDMRSRSTDFFAALLAGLMVLLFGPIGLLLYLLLRPRETLAEAYDRALEEEALLREIESRVVCPTCSQSTDPDWMLCPFCHTQLKKPCAECGKLMEMPWRLCPYCGSAPEYVAAPASTEAAPSAAAIPFETAPPIPPAAADPMATDVADEAPPIAVPAEVVYASDDLEAEEF